MSSIGMAISTPKVENVSRIHNKFDRFSFFFHVKVLLLLFFFFFTRLGEREVLTSYVLLFSFLLPMFNFVYYRFLHFLFKTFGFTTLDLGEIYICCEKKQKRF